MSETYREEDAILKVLDDSHGLGLGLETPVVLAGLNEHILRPPAARAVPDYDPMILRELYRCRGRRASSEGTGESGAA
jgi:hypothetical protein